MLRRIHDKVKGIIATVVVSFIIAAFLFVGVSEIRSPSSSQVAAVVGDKKITWAAVLALSERLAKERAISERDPRFIANIRDLLIRHDALYQGFYQEGFRVSDRQVAKVLSSIPNFQVDGKFSKEKYLAALSDFAYQETNFRQELGQNILLTQAEEGIFSSKMLFPTEGQQALELLEQTRDLGYVILPKNLFLKKIKSTVAEWKQYYESYRSRYVVPERVAVQYVELSLDRVSQNIQYSEAELEKFYQENLSFYNTPDMRHVRHILWITEGQDSQAQQSQKAKAEKVLAELQAGADFEAMAKAVSEDEQSKEQGGDLGWVTRGELDSTVEEAIFALNAPNAISGVVKSPYGYHIIQLLEQKLATTRAFKDVRASVIEQYQKQKALELFEEKKEQLATLSFESPDGLETIQRVMGLNVYESKLFDRQGHGAEKWSEQPEFIKAAFSPGVLVDHKNSGIVHLTPEKVMVLHLKDHQAAQQADFDSVKMMVKSDYEEQAVSQSLQTASENILKALKKGDSPTMALKPYGLNWDIKTGLGRMSTELDRFVLDQAFQVPSQPFVSGQYHSLILPNGDHLIMTVMSVKPGDWREVESKLRHTYEKHLNDNIAQLEFSLLGKEVSGSVSVKVSPLPKILQSEAPTE